MSQGTADLKATFKGRKHEVNVSTYAMVILLAFNQLEPGESLSYEELKDMTSIPEEDLIRNLQSLAVAPKSRLLLKKPMSKDVQPTDRFSFNENFTSKFTRFRVGVVATNRAETDKEKRETSEMVDKDRAHQIEAAVVRTMKQRKKLGHQELLLEVIKQLSNRFQPDPSAIKKRIESLIERDYLERCEDQRNTYKYLVSNLPLAMQIPDALTNFDRLDSADILLVCLAGPLVMWVLLCIVGWIDEEYTDYPCL